MESLFIRTKINLGAKIFRGENNMYPSGFKHFLNHFFITKCFLFDIQLVQNFILKYYEGLCFTPTERFSGPLLYVLMILDISLISLLI